MSETASNSKTGSYTASLIGNIRTHLAGLQGYDLMALELIQNADDAKAEEIIFDITDKGLLFRNSAQFTYCGDLNKPCASFEQSQYKCDYHRITDVGSGGKLSRGENIGCFGIGFVSTYQITDRPQIRSAGIKLTLLPEQGRWDSESFEEPRGTSFFLPWADNPSSEARLALGGSHVCPEHINQLVNDFQKVLRKSLLFLRHVRKAEVRRNGKLLLACDLERKNGSELIVRFRPNGEVERWHILRTDVTDAAKQLYSTYPMPESLHNRSTQVSIGFEIKSEQLNEGLLYAFLPTEQSTGMPLHINADFFPEPDRKAVIFAGHQYQQAWNEMLIDAAAAEIARDQEGLLKMLGHIQLWQILSRAYDLSSKPSGHPQCYQRFWDQLKATATQAHIVVTQDGSAQLPVGVFLTNAPFNEHQVKAFIGVGGKLVAEELRQFRVVMNQLGAPILTLERLVDLLEPALRKDVTGKTEVNPDKLKRFYRPLWSIANDLIPESNSVSPRIKLSIDRLLALPFIVTEDLFAVTINQTNFTPDSLNANRIAVLLPRLAIASRYISDFSNIRRLIELLDLDKVASHISSMSDSEPVEEVISIEKNDLRDLYSLFADLDKPEGDCDTYKTLQELPIWLSSRGLVKADQAMLPGNFTDPTGQADLLDISVLTPLSRSFLIKKLGVKEQTIDAFARHVLPNFFNKQGPIDTSKHNQLISELASHPSLIDSNDIRELLAVASSRSY